MPEKIVSGNFERMIEIPRGILVRFPNGFEAEYTVLGTTYRDYCEYKKRGKKDPSKMETQEYSF